MAKLDALIAALFTHQGQELFFRTGTGVTLRVGDKQREIMRKPLDLPQLEAVIREIMPEKQVIPPQDGGAVLFHYRAPSGEVQVACERLQGHMRVSITPALAVPEEPPPTPAEPPPLEALSSQPPAELLVFAARQQASDVHLRTGLAPILRIGGELAPLHTHPPIDAAYIEEHLLGLGPESARARWAEARETTFSVTLGDVARARIALLSDRAGPVAVVHLAPLSVPGLDEIGISAVAREVFAQKRGLVLVASPAGAGKSTTLASVVDDLNRTRTSHIVTAEDPIEYALAPQLAVLTQREVGQHVKSITEGLKQAFVLDADIVVAGDVRELDSIMIALRLAEAGKLVLIGVSAGSTPQALAGLVDRFPADRQPIVRAALSNVFAGATCQVLVRGTSGGRIAAIEVLASTPAIRRAIRENRLEELTALQHASRAEGSLLREDALADLVRRGFVAEEDALALATVPGDFYAALAPAGAAPAA